MKGPELIQLGHRTFSSWRWRHQKHVYLKFGIFHYKLRNKQKWKLLFFLYQ